MADGLLHVITTDFFCRNVDNYVREVVLLLLVNSAEHDVAENVSGVVPIMIELLMQPFQRGCIMLSSRTHNVVVDFSEGAKLIQS